VQAAQGENKDTMVYLDEMGEKWKHVRNDLQISFTDFIRTTQADHKALVTSMLQKSFDK
jgi:methionyl-tRNA synthetase